MSGMPGVRTPVKSRSLAKASQDKSPQMVPEHAGPSTQSVRRSVGEWEAGKTVTKRTPPPKKLDPTPPVMSISFEVGSPPTQKSRVLEARMCSNKIKALMTTSKTTKNEIKAEVKAQADRLYQLVKELENLTKPPTGKMTATTGTQVQEAQKTEKVSIPAPVANREVDTESLRKALEEHSHNLAVHSEKMDRLKEALQTGQEHIEKLSYARVAASRPAIQTPNLTALHSIVVTAKDEEESGEQVLDRIRKVVNAKEGGIEVEKVRKAKDRKVIMGCRTEEERRKLRERLSKAPELEAQDIKNRNPQVILREVMQYLTNEEVPKALQKQNANLFKNLKDEHSKVEVLYRKRARNPLKCHVVLRVATEVWRRMLEVGSVHLDLGRVKVEDQSPLVQCSLCLGYGHSRRTCTESVAKCSHCGGPHMRTECTDWSAGLPPTCCNCVRAKIDSTHHHAFSSECTVRRRWDAIARSSIAYC